MENATIWATAVGLASLTVGMTLGWLLAAARASAGRSAAQAKAAAAAAERDLQAARVTELEAALREDQRTAAELAPLRQTLRQVHQQVGQLERDRAHQFGAVGEQLQQVAAQTHALGLTTSTLAGALTASARRGTWGEVQLRRLLEHSGMLPRCDFDEQVSAVSAHEAAVRPDVVVHLPGDKTLVIDAKVPMDAFLRSHDEGVDDAERQRLLTAHSRALRGHVETLSKKAYWSAFATSPELVVCFLPNDAVLSAALHADPDLYDDAQARRVVLASPAVLLTLLRALALAWQQDALSRNAEQLLQLGSDLHQRLSTLGRHVSGMGASLRRSVEAYNAMVGSLESRVLVTSRQLHELGLAEAEPDPVPPVTTTPRTLTAAELIDDDLRREAS